MQKKNTFKDREKTYWRYFELLPIIDKKNIVSIEAGMTPLVKAEKLGKELGLNNLYIKNDSVNPINKYAISKLGGECAVKMYNNSLILRIMMCEKPFIHKSAFYDIKTNFIF